MKVRIYFKSIMSPSGVGEVKTYDCDFIEETEHGKVIYSNNAPIAFASHDCISRVEYLNE